jgi:hypothetical protein
MSRLRNLACWIMIAVALVSLCAADSGAGMLYAKGTAWINGSMVPRTSAVFPGDLVQTRSDSVASINASGSNLIILEDSLIKFDGPSSSLEHGSVTVATSKGMIIRSGEITVAPASTGWTEFEVKGSDGSVRIVAQKGDVKVSDGSDTSTLSQGQQTTVDQTEKKKKKKKKKAAGAIPSGGGGVLSSPILYGGLAAAGGVIVWVLLPGDNPISQKSP